VAGSHLRFSKEFQAILLDLSTNSRNEIETSEEFFKFNSFWCEAAKNW
jgi:hypothetical protein